MVQRLLMKRPEQEKRLLEVLVDKLGDPDSTIAAKTLHLLNQLCKPFLLLTILLHPIHFSGTTSGYENCFSQRNRTSSLSTKYSSKCTVNHPSISLLFSSI